MPFPPPPADDTPAAVGEPMAGDRAEATPHEAADEKLRLSIDGVVATVRLVVARHGGEARAQTEVA